MRVTTIMIFPLKLNIFCRISDSITQDNFNYSYFKEFPVFHDSLCCSAWAVIYHGDIYYYDDGDNMQVCQLAGPECQGESSAEHLHHVLGSDRFGHSHTQQAPAWNSTVQLPWQCTGNTHTLAALIIIKQISWSPVLSLFPGVHTGNHTHIQYTLTLKLRLSVLLCVFIFSCGRGWFLGDSPAPTQKSKSTYCWSDLNR